jgi:hypothetical protein
MRCPVTLPTISRSRVSFFCASCIFVQCFHFFSRQMDVALPVALKLRVMQLELRLLDVFPVKSARFATHGRERIPTLEPCQ